MASLLVGAAIVAATILGPIMATHGADGRRAAADKRDAKMRVFRDLMGHRYSPTHPNYVAALNLIQIEFSDVPNVMSAFFGYLDAFHPDKAGRSDGHELQKKAIIRLLTAVAAHLGYSLEGLDLMEQVYRPQLWVDEAEQQAAVRKLLHDVATGKRAFPVLAVVPSEFYDDLGGGRYVIRTTSVTTTPQPGPAKPPRKKGILG